MCGNEEHGRESCDIPRIRACRVLNVDSTLLPDIVGLGVRLLGSGDYCKFSLLPVALRYIGLGKNGTAVDASWE